MPAETATASMLDDETCAALLPDRPIDGHKFTFGVVVAVAGSIDYAGAALMTALGAARAGAGMVALAIPDTLRPVFAGRLPEAILLGLDHSGDDDVAPGLALEAIDAREPAAIVFGPGLFDRQGYRLLLQLLLQRAGAPMVIDAGALAMLADSGDWWQRTKRECVLTPHVGEFRRITGVEVGHSDDKRVAACRDAAERFGQVVVLKGPLTVIAAPDSRYATSPFANPLLATAGSGDVLAGYLAGLIAQGAEPYDAARAGVYLHGRAGQRLSEKLGDAGLLATELPLEMAIARREVVSGRRD